MDNSRRKNLKKIGTGLLAVPTFSTSAFLLDSCSSPSKGKEMGSEDNASAPLFFGISLAQWSLHRSFFGKSRELGWAKFQEMITKDADSVLQGELKPINFAEITRQTYGIDAVEYVNQFFKDKSENMDYMSDLKGRADGEGVKSQLIMVDGEGNLGDTDESKRMMAVENHYKWVDAAKYLGCHSIRVNAGGQGSSQEVADAAIQGLGKLSEYGASNEINIIVENHGSYSSDGKWLSNVIGSVNNEYCGTLPDFGNFCVEGGESGCEVEYDRYVGTRELMPYAKGVSAKSHEFDVDGNEVNTDYVKMLKIVKGAGYSGYVGIEYEGGGLSEEEGIKMTKSLLEKAGKAV